MTSVSSDIDVPPIARHREIALDTEPHIAHLAICGNDVLRETNMHEIETVLDATDPHGCGIYITRLRVESGWIYYRRLRDGSVDSTTAAFVPDSA